MLVSRIGLSGLPVAPAEVDEAVELWARKSGRHGSVKFHPMLLCWFVELDLVPDHPKLKLWKDGLLKQSSPPTESILLRRWDGQRWVPLDIEQLGPSGVTTILEKGDTWSGRGEYSSLVEACEAAIQANEEAREALSQMAYDVGAEIGSVGRRMALHLPQVSVPADIEPSPTTPTGAGT